MVHRPPTSIRRTTAAPARSEPKPSEHLLVALRQLAPGNDAAMSNAAAALLSAETRAAVRAYCWLEVARSEFDTSPSELTTDQRERVQKLVEQKLSLEQVILESPEATQTEFTASKLDERMAALSARFAGPDQYADALRAEGITPSEHRLAVAWSLHVEEVLERVAATAVPPSEEEERAAYEAHREQFARPERREVSHIMIVHAPSESGQREQAFSRLKELRQLLDEPDSSFELLAQLHSECPSALKGGSLGMVRQGMLFQELDAELFSMQSGEIRGPIVTEGGTHLLRCGTIYVADYVPFEEVRQSLYERLLKAAQSNAQRQWIRRLRREARS